MDAIDVVAVHGFPLDWNLWSIDEWPAKLDEIRAVTDKPVWVTEAGVSSFGSEEVQAWGVRKTAELLLGKAPGVHWYSLYDLPRTWEATTRHKEAEGRPTIGISTWACCARTESPKPGLEVYAEFADRMGLCQWFHFEDHRLDRRGRLDEAAWSSPRAHGPFVGRQFSPGRPALVRPSDGGARRLRGHGDLLLHARAQGVGAPPQQPAGCSPKSSPNSARCMVRRYAPGRAMAAPAVAAA